MIGKGVSVDNAQEQTQRQRNQMPNIATALNAEISRIARKELRTETEALKKAAAGYRRDIAALKKRMQTLERQAKSATRKTAPVSENSPGQSETQHRFSATRFAAQRQKLGLSAANFATLLGVSSLSVYKWESGKTRPRRAQLEAIAATRRLGKREVMARLAEVNAKI
jgi:DNA-binding transcriptional regulator YiaG